MAVQPAFLEAGQKSYLSGLQNLVKQPINTSSFAPNVQRQSQFGQAAQQQLARQAGLGSIQFDPKTGGVQSIGAGTGIAGFEPYLKTAEQYSGPGAYQQFMSPYQQDVIDTTMQEYDLQSQQGMKNIADQAVSAGAFGGGREGVQRAQYQAKSDQNRAALQAQLLQQGFGQANQMANQAFGQQTNLATLQPALAGQSVAGLQAAGGADLAYRQAVEDANRQGRRLQAYEPYERTSFFGTGLGSLASGMPAQQIGGGAMSSPQLSPLETALQMGGNLGGIYGAISG